MNWTSFTTALAAMAFILMVVVGTASTANKVRTARHGPQLPNATIVRAWLPTDGKLVRDMQDYIRSFSKTP